MPGIYCVRNTNVNVGDNRGKQQIYAKFKDTK